MVCFITIISLTRQGWAWPHEMTRTIIIAIAAVLYVLAAGHVHHSIVNDAAASLKARFGTISARTGWLFGFHPISYVASDLVRFN